MLHVRALHRPGIEPVDLDLAEGEAVAVLGPSGSGKTLMLRSIADLDPNEGEVSLNGKSREGMSGPAWRRQVTYLAAEPGWWAERAADHFPDPPAAEALLPALNLAAKVMGQPISELSTGERHRLALARVLVQSPKVMLLDEPTSGLDTDAARAVEAALAERLSNGAALIFSTHDEDQARRLARRRLRMSGGQARAEATEDAR